MNVGVEIAFSFKRELDDAYRCLELPEGASVLDAFRMLANCYPVFCERVFDEAGEIRRNINALINGVGGATWVSFHHGGGVGIGYSQHAGQVIVADGTPEAARRLERVLTTDPGMAIMRHADAGYPEAIAAAKRHGLKIPMMGNTDMTKDEGRNTTITNDL